MSINRTCRASFLHMKLEHAMTNYNYARDSFFLVTEHAVQNPNVEEQVHGVPHRRKEMTEDLRKRVYQTLLGRSNDGILHKKDTAYVAAQFDLHIQTVQRV